MSCSLLGPHATFVTGIDPLVDGGVTSANRIARGRPRTRPRASDRETDRRGRRLLVVGGGYIE